MTKKEKEVFERDVTNLLASICIRFYNKPIDEMFQEINRTNFTQTVKKEAIKRIKEVRTND